MPAKDTNIAIMTELTLVLKKHDVSYSHSCNLLASLLLNFARELELPSSSTKSDTHVITIAPLEKGVGADNK
jgi:hypothetical protein